MTEATLNAGALDGFPPEPGRKPAAVLAVLVHVVFFSILVFGLRWSTRAPDAVVVELWNPSPTVEPRVEPRDEPVQVEPKPVPKVEPKVQPRAEPQPVTARKPDIAIEKEKKPVPKPEPKLNIDRSKAINDELQRELQQVSSEREKAAKAAKTSPPSASAPSIDPGYANRIRQKIKANIVVPADVIGNPEAIFEVIQLPTGEILQPQLRLRKSSGHKGYDDAVERAILKASPLPRPDRADQFQRQLELKFRPQD